MERIKIYSPTGELLIDSPVNTGSKRRKELMKEDHITVKVSLQDPVFIPIGSWCAGEDIWRYATTDLQNQPTYNKSTGAYDYTIQLDAYYYAWKNKLFKYSPTYGNSWKLTDTLANHMKVFLSSLKSLGFSYGDTGADYEAASDDTIEDIAEAKLLTYDGVYMIDALTQMANEWDCEWWVTDNVIHFGHCEDYGNDIIDLSIGDNCESITPSASKQTYGTRLYAYGSTRNIPKRYRKDLIFTVDTISGRTFGDSTRPLKTSMFTEDAAPRTQTATAAMSGGASEVVGPDDGAFTVKGDAISSLSGSGVLPSGEWSAENAVEVSFSAERYSGSGIQPMDSVLFELSYVSDDETFTAVLATQRYTMDSGDWGTDITLPAFDLSDVVIKAENAYSGFRLVLTVTPSFSETGSTVQLKVTTTGSVTLTATRRYAAGSAAVTIESSGSTDTLNGLTLECDYNPSATKDGENKLWLPSGYSFTDGNTYKFTIDESDLIISEIPSSYYTSRFSNDIITYGISDNRLMLPEGTPYIDSEEGLTDAEVVEEVKVFEDIYPKTECAVGSVTTHTYQDTEEDEYGNEATVEWDAYRITTPDITFSEDYQLDDTDLQIQFQTGSLAGFIFNVTFYDVGKLYDDGAYNTEQVFEITRNDDYGRDLPDTILKPKAGDEFILIGWDAGALAGLGLISKAELELKEEAEKYIAESKIDPNTYSCSLLSDYAYGLDADGNKNTEYKKEFDIGQRVRIVNAAFFKEGSRESRVIGFERCLDLPYDTPSYTVGESTSYSRLGEIEDNIETLTLKGNETSVSGGSSVYHIKSNDSTKASDNNAYSALRADKEFLSRLDDDSAEGVITFLAGLALGSKGKYGLAADGAATLYKAVTDVLTAATATLGSTTVTRLVSLLSAGGTRGDFGSGIAAFLTAAGAGRIETDELLVRKKAIFRELEIRRLSYVGGDFLFSPAGCTVDSVVVIDEEGNEAADDASIYAYRCYYTADDGTTATTNSFAVDDQALCQTFNIKEGVYENVSNRYYWRRVVAVGDGYIDLSATDCDEGSDIPAKGDVLACAGNRTDQERQAALRISTYGTDAPAIQAYRGINSYHWGQWTDSAGVKHNNRVMLLSPAAISLNSYIFSWSNDVEEFPNTVYVGDWTEGTAYYYYQQVTHDGCEWLCLLPDGEACYSEPAIGNDEWKLVSGTPTSLVKDKYRMEIDQSLAGTMAPGETETVTCTIYNGYNDDVTDQFTLYTVTRDTGDESSDAVWNAAHTNTGNPFEIAFADLGIDGISKLLATFTVTATDEATDTQSVAEVDYYA